MKTSIKKAFRERKPPPRPKCQPKVIRYSNQDWRINLAPDADVCRICPKLYVWLSEKCYVQNIPQWWRKGKSDPTRADPITTKS